MFDEINEYIAKHEEKLKREKRTFNRYDELTYQNLILQVRESTERMRNTLFDEDPDEAIKRLSAELSLRDDLDMRSIRATLNKYKIGKEELGDQEKATLLKFLSSIPVLEGKVDSTLYGTETFKKMMQSLDIMMLQRYQYIYRKGQPIENVFYIMRGEVVRVEENRLDLKKVLDVPYNPKDIKSFIARLIRNKLIKCIPELYANTTLKRFTALGRQKYFMDDIETNENFMRSCKRQVEINENLEIIMRKCSGTLPNGSVFGEDEVMDNKSKYQSSALAKYPSWILKIKQSTFKAEMKESVRRIKEAKAVFLFYSMPYNSKGFGYMKFKDFFMKNFKLEKIAFNTKVAKQGHKSGRIMIIHHGVFALIKKVYFNVGYYEKHKMKAKDIFLILGQGSIIGEDEFFNDQPSSYTVKSI